MPPVGFEPTISAGERPQTYALDRAAIGTGFQDLVRHANTAHAGGRYTSNQQLYDLMYIGWRNIRGTQSTLYLPPTKGVANLIDLQAKCHAHFLRRCLKWLHTEDAYTPAWLKLWNSHFYIVTALHM